MDLIQTNLHLPLVCQIENESMSSLLFAHCKKTFLSVRLKVFPPCSWNHRVSSQWFPFGKGCIRNVRNLPGEIGREKRLDSREKLSRDSCLLVFPLRSFDSLVVEARLITAERPQRPPAGNLRGERRMQGCLREANKSKYIDESIDR